MCSLGVKAGGFNWLPKQKLKETPTKQVLIDCFFWNVFSVISDGSYYERLTDDDIFEICGKRHTVSSIVRYQ